VGDPQQRLALLQGLVSQLGELIGHGTIEATPISADLAGDRACNAL
jgi:hypothetical protein